MQDVIRNEDRDVAKGIAELQIEFSGLGPLGFLNKDVMSVLFKKFNLYNFFVVDTREGWRSF